MKNDILNARLTQLKGDMSAIQAAADAAGRSLTTEEAADFDAKLASFQDTEKEIARRESLEAVEAKLAAPRERPVVESIRQVSASSANHGFRHQAEYFTAVRNAAFGRVDPRLVQAAVTTYGGEQVGPDGGFAVPPDFRGGIQQAWDKDENLSQHFSAIQTSSNLLVLPFDETSPHASGGITGAWTDEAGTSTPTKPSIKQVNVNLKKVQALVHLSDEMISDAAFIASYVPEKMGQKLSSLISDAIYNGDGNGKPIGMMASPARVSVTRETGGTVTAKDVTTAVSRLRPGGFANSFWLVHSSVLPKLWTMVVGQIPVYVPNFAVSPYGQLLGRPVFVTEYAQTVGTSGDVMLVNPSGYAYAVKSDGVQTAATIAFAFDQGLQSFRATVRVGGVPMLSAAIGRKNGSDTLTDFVTIS